MCFLPQNILFQYARSLMAAKHGLFIGCMTNRAAIHWAMSYRYHRPGC
ncbi:hypothetical protein GCK32_016696 [Trichostrongylus colubriformis]|uniref:Uncharacterized protein n=1 Tax=Trichostrongylus colubriformis TaxID=6319 RepID=A0AAN8FE61_TRICO